jgi:hypothetical protein
MKPNRCEFSLHIEADMPWLSAKIFEDGDICLCISDLDEPDNDDIRDVLHPDFDRFWGNACENVFLSNGFKDFKTIEDARRWCLAIGMVESTELLQVGG